jgi:hypothetical protein
VITVRKPLNYDYVSFLEAGRPELFHAHQDHLSPEAIGELMKLPASPI